MDAKLLRNLEEFDRWKTTYLAHHDFTDLLPLKFPCWAIAVVLYEESCAMYLYREDIEGMLAELE